MRSRRARPCLRMAFPFLRSRKFYRGLVRRTIVCFVTCVHRKAPCILSPHRIMLHQITETRLCATQNVTWQSRLNRARNGFEICNRVADSTEHAHYVQFGIKVFTAEPGDPDPCAEINIGLVGCRCRDRSGASNPVIQVWVFDVLRLRCRQPRTCSRG